MTLRQNLIDNYVQLKNIQIREGHSFSSNTDSEIVAHLIEKHMNGYVEATVKKASLFFAYYIATALNWDIDQPRNLAKTVTVE